MAEQTPPFTALRAVEAASRHKSFTWAARELNVTHSAVSQSIRRLEAELGASLFERRHGAMEPSEAALRLAQAYSTAAESLGQTLREITGATVASTVRLAMPGDFGRQWFAGRMARLTDALPDVRFDIVTADAEAADAEILFEDRPRLSDETLADLNLFPIGGAPFLKAQPLSAPADVLSAPLYAERRFGWSLWAARYAPRATLPPIQVLDDASMALEAAVRGNGLALAHAFSAEPFLESGRAAVLPFVVPTTTRLVLRRKQATGKVDPLNRLVMWLKLEIGRSAALFRAR